MATEKRLIDANEYPCNRCEISYCYKNCDKFNAWFENTVDAEEVVRCGGCIYSANSMSVPCAYVCNREGSPCYKRITYADFGCLYGERRTDATE